MKYKKSLLVVAFSIFVLVFCFFYFQKYSIVDLNADNYKELLLKNSFEKRIDISDSESINLNLLYLDNPDRINFYKLWESDDLAEKYKVTRELGKNGGLFLEVYNKLPLNNFYNVSYNLKRFPIYFMMNLNSGPLMKQVLDKLMVKEGFILKKSSFIKGHDILIKETESTFVIVELIEKYDEVELNEFPGYQVSINMYSKKIYF